jgi:hypothetical protein
MLSGRDYRSLVTAPCGTDSAQHDAGSASDWATEIRRVWAEGGVNTLVLAKVVCAARAHLDRGQGTEFSRSGRIPFSLRKGKMLVVIGEGLGWANGQTFARLPRGWSILNWLARIDRSDLERLILEGTVHPQLKPREAKDLVARLCGQRPATNLNRPDVLRRLDNLDRFVDSTLSEWSWRQLRFAPTKLREIALRVENCVSEPRVLGQTLLPESPAILAAVSGDPCPTKESFIRIPMPVSA